MVDQGDSDFRNCTPNGLQPMTVEAIARERGTEAETIADESERTPGGTQTSGE